MKVKSEILIFCMVFVANTVFCQKSTPFSKINGQLGLVSTTLPTTYYVPILPLKILPANFYASGLGFFCKKELKFEYATKIPFKFRLGNLPYCDWLEGKKNAGILPAAY